MDIKASGDDNDHNYLLSAYIYLHVYFCHSYPDVITIIPNNIINLLITKHDMNLYKQQKMETWMNSSHKNSLQQDFAKASDIIFHGRVEKIFKTFVNEK